MTTEPIKSGWLFLTRIYWLMFGPAILILLALQIANRSQRELGFADGLFLIGLLAIVVARWFEVRNGAALDGFGEPARPADLPRFVVGALLIGFVLWLAAKSIAIFWPF